MKRVLQICFNITLLFHFLFANSIITVNEPVDNIQRLRKAIRGLKDETEPGKVEGSGANVEDKGTQTSAPQVTLSPEKEKLKSMLKASDTLKPTLTYLKEKEKIEDIKRVQNLDDIDVQCNPDLLYAFGIQEKVYQPQIASSNERKYCRRNALTCCNTRHIENTIKKFSAGAKAFKERFEIVEELFILFRGPAYQMFLIELENDTTCQHIFDDHKLTRENLFDPNFMEEKLDFIMSLLIDLEIYTKRQLWFYSDFVCTICSPINHKYFNLSPNGSKMDVHVSTCSDIMEIKEFEITMIEVFDSFIAKIANFIVCKSEDNQKAFGAVDMSKIIEQKNTLDRCYKNTFNINDPVCQSFCQKSLEKLEFPTEFFGIASGATRVLYEFFSGNKIEDYYELVKKREYTEEGLDGDITFFNTENVKYDVYKMAELKWNLHSDKGVTIFSDPMSKKYNSSTYLATISALVLSMFAVLIRV